MSDRLFIPEKTVFTLIQHWFDIRQKQLEKGRKMRKTESKYILNAENISPVKDSWENMKWWNSEHDKDAEVLINLA